MSLTWRAALDGLRRPLQLAARNAVVPGLGVALRLASERALALRPDPDLLQWARTTERLESLAPSQQREHIAAGLLWIAAAEQALVGDPAGALQGETPSRRESRSHVSLPSRSPRADVRPRPAGPQAPVLTGPQVPAGPQPDRPGRGATVPVATETATATATETLRRHTRPAAATRTRIAAATPARAARPAVPGRPAPLLSAAAAVAAAARQNSGSRRTAPAAARQSSGSRRTAPAAARQSSGSRRTAPAVPLAAPAAPMLAPGQAGPSRPLRPIDADGQGAQQPTRSLRGIGPVLAARLAERGVVTIEDLLWILPRHYDDLRDLPSLAQCLGTVVDEDREVERAIFVAVVSGARMVFARGRRWAELRLTSPEQPQGPVRLLARCFKVWAGIEQRLPPGARVVMSGLLQPARAVAGAAKGPAMPRIANPEILEILTGAAAELGHPGARIVPRYPDLRGIPAARMRSACQLACERVAQSLDDGVPASAERSCALPSLLDSITTLHRPGVALDRDSVTALDRGDSQWHRRLAFGELFSLAVAVALRRADRRNDVALPCPERAGAPAIAAIVTALPFALTSAQRRVISEISVDLSSTAPMNRLLEGDVGAGKTIVALAAALQAVRAGCQVALMAPTAVLAEQHAASWRTLAATLRLRLELLTAATPRTEAAALLARLASGELDLVIGTHALLSADVQFARLGFCIIDEQHRFGVAQRVQLRAKGYRGHTPHLLVMTATPIPRTLALTAYGDLEISILDELPPGRQPTLTRVLRGRKGEDEAIALITRRVAHGERAFVVCPKVESESGGAGQGHPGSAARGDAAGRAAAELPWRDATSVAAELAKRLPRVGLVHGRSDAATRDAVMRAFRDGDLDVLVATTVIEVGVDVPEATVMTIFDADRFGLSQLHQLRGRVGRGSARSHCLLLVRGAVSEEGARRLEVMTQTHDGFAIAEHDLRLRGPGELFGARQAGVPRLRLGDPRDYAELLLAARRAAESVVASDPDLARPEHAGLAAALRRRLGGPAIFGADSG